MSTPTDTAASTRGETLRQWVIGHKTVTLLELAPTCYRVNVSWRSGSASSFSHKTLAAAQRHFERAIRR